MNATTKQARAIARDHVPRTVIERCAIAWIALVIFVGAAWFGASIALGAEPTDVALSATSTAANLLDAAIHAAATKDYVAAVLLTLSVAAPIAYRVVKVWRASRGVVR